MRGAPITRFRPRVHQQHIRACSRVLLEFDEVFARDEDLLLAVADGSKHHQRIISAPQEYRANR